MTDTSNTIYFHRQGDGSVAATLTRHDDQATRILTWAGFHPAATAAEVTRHVLPAGLSEDEAAVRTARAGRLLEAAGYTIATQVDIWRPPPPDMATAVSALDALTAELPGMWHPEEVAGNLHQAAGGHHSVTAALHRFLDGVLAWTVDSPAADHHPEAVQRIATRLEQAARLLKAAQRHVTTALPELSRLARLDPPPTAPPPPTPSPRTPPTRPR